MSNITKHFKAKQGMRNCFADGLVQDRMVEGTPQAYVPNADLMASANQRIASQNQAFDAMQKQQPVGGPTQGEQASIARQSNLNNLGTVNPTPGLGEGAQRNFFNKSMSDLQGGNNQPYTPGSAGDPRATAAYGPKGPTHIAPAAPGRTPLRPYQEPAFAEGMVPATESPAELSARIAAKYGVSGNAPVAAPQPAPVPQPVQQAPKPQSGGLLGNALRGMRSAGDQLRQVANYKDGLVHEGPGIVHGPGGPKEDKVDAKLSAGEAVLPAATVEYLGGSKEVAHLIEMTNGKAPAVGLRGGVKASGGLIDGWGLGRSPAPTIHGNGGLPAPVVEAGIKTMQGQLAEQPNPNPQTQIPAETIKQNIVTMRDQSTIPDPNRPTDPSTDGRRTYSSETAPAFVNRSTAPVVAAKPAAPYRNEGGSVPNQISAANPSVVSLRDRTLVDNTLGKDARSPDMTNRWVGNDPMKAQQYVSDTNAAQGLRNNPANGHGVVSINQPGGKVKNVLMGPSEYTAADGSKTSDWTKTTQFAEGTAQAAKDKASLRQLQYENAKFNATSDQIKDPRAQAAGLRALAQYDIEEKQKAETAKAGELAGLRRDANAINREQLSENARQFNVGQSEKRLLAQAAAREKGVSQMQEMLGKAGFKGQEAVDFEDFIYQNHADNLSTLPHAEQLKVLPRLKADFQDMKTRNLNSTNGTSWKNSKRVKVDKLDYEADAAIDPTGVVDNKVWFGSGTDGKGLGKANIFLRKNLPDVMFGSDNVDVMDNGQRIMSKDNRGARGPHGSIDMREINRLSLKDAAK